MIMTFMHGGKNGISPMSQIYKRHHTKLSNLLFLMLYMYSIIHCTCQIYNLLNKLAF